MVQRDYCAVKLLDLVCGGCLHIAAFCYIIAPIIGIVFENKGVFIFKSELFYEAILA